ncbi:thermonuclease family protein [bacterium]|nr:thermonuclease family protein [bacterium]MBU1752276.1 thermonuclease family protein [bacterium]
MRLFIVLLMILSANAEGFCGELVNEAKGTITGCTVVRIKDGDTVEVRPMSGATFTVRLLGINTPETAKANKHTPDEPYAVEAMKFTEKELLNQSISLLVSNNGSQTQDMYSRTLGVIILNGEVFNTKLLAQGLAARCFINNDCLNFLKWEAIEVEARKQGLGLWANMGKKGIVINELHPNPKGADSASEFAELYNTTDQTIDLSNWSFGINENTVFVAGCTIAPYGYLILTTAQDFRAIHSGIPDTVPIIRVSANYHGVFSLLSNTATPPQNLVVHLKDDSHGYQDSITYNLNWDNKEAKDTGYTLERISPIRINVGDSLINGADDENWGTSTVLNGTPGGFNSIGTIAVIYLDILLNNPMIGKATDIQIQAMDGNNQILTNYQGTITLTIEPMGSISNMIVMKDGVATTSATFSQLGKLRITAKDAVFSNRCGMLEFNPELLGDFGQKGSQTQDNLINFNDMMWFSYYWNTKDPKADLGSDRMSGVVPTLVSPLDGSINFYDMMIFTSMWNWWNGAR